MTYEVACKVLGIAIGASDQAVHNAWRVQVKRLHPDRNQGQRLYEQATRELNEARKVAVQMRPTHMPERKPAKRRKPKPPAKPVVDWENPEEATRAAEEILRRDRSTAAAQTRTPTPPRDPRPGPTANRGPRPTPSRRGGLRFYWRGMACLLIVVGFALLLWALCFFSVEDFCICVECLSAP